MAMATETELVSKKITKEKEEMRMKGLRYIPKEKALAKYRAKK